MAPFHALLNWAADGPRLFDLGSGWGTQVDGKVVEAQPLRSGNRLTIGGHTLTSVLVAGTGAIEITVHGWDVARACGRTDPVPPALADELLDLAPLLVACTDRPGRFDRPVPVPPGAAPGDRLVAFLGRQP